MIRNRAIRTTQDVDVLVRKEDWPEIRKSLSDDFAIEVDSAVDLDTNVDVDFLFAGDQRDGSGPLPDPVLFLEFDSDLQANFLPLLRILELKTAVYLQKKRDEGIEIAAKDLADVVELLTHNRERLTPELMQKLHPAIKKELERIRRKIRDRSGRPRTGRW